VERALTALSLRLVGKAAAATMARRKRAVFYNVLDMASTGKGRVLAANPLNTIKWKPPEAAEKVDRRVVCNPRQARELLTALSYVGGLDRNRGRRLVAMFACMYYAALRPAEAVNLHKSDCELPETGWGRIYISRTTPEVGKRYTDSGDLHDEKGLKHRPDDEVRPVPIPPELSPFSAGTWRSSAPRRMAACSASRAAASSPHPHTRRYGGRPALAPDQVASPLASRPVRPAARSGIPLAERRGTRHHDRPPRWTLSRRAPSSLRELHRR
jgi:integrase